jgi:hypothetical protein
MSGMSNGAFADICSLRSVEDRIAHWNNVLKFAIFKKDNALLAIGDPWNEAIDGGDPSTGCSYLIQIAIRYVIKYGMMDDPQLLTFILFLELEIVLIFNLLVRIY